MRVSHQHTAIADWKLFWGGLPLSRSRCAVSGHPFCGDTPCIQPRANRKVQYTYDKALYKQRHKIQNGFARIEDWRRVATRYDRCANTFISAISIAATVCTQGINEP